MAYPLPSLAQSMQLLVAMFKGELPTRNISSRFSFYWKLLKTFAGGITDLHAKQRASQIATQPWTARGDVLLAWSKLVGITPKGATPARKSAALRIRGGVASTVAAGELMVHSASGLRFQVAQAVTIPASGYFDADVAAVDVGAITRLEAGEVLEFLAPPVGIQTKAELQLALDEDGYDAEQDGSLSARMQAAFAERGAGGNDADWVAWSLAYTAISAAYVYPGRAGAGTVDVAVLHDGNGSARSLSVGEGDDFLAYLRNLAPSQLKNGALRRLTTVADVVDVELTITPNGDAAYAFDWDDTSPLTVFTWTPATRILQFAALRPATMKAGDRLVLRGVASAQLGEVLTIEALTSTDSVILQRVPTVAPANGDVAYAGGPLTDSIRAAVIAHMNGQLLYADDNGPLPASLAASTVNLRVLAEGIGTANPNGLYGAWSGTVVRAVLGKIASYTRGVRNVAVVAPATDTDATDYAFPTDDQIGFITPGAVLIRRG